MVTVVGVVNQLDLCAKELCSSVDARDRATEEIIPPYHLSLVTITKSLHPSALALAEQAKSLLRDSSVNKNIK